MKKCYADKLTPEEIELFNSIKYSVRCGAGLNTKDGWVNYHLLVTINGAIFDYHVGTGHAISPPENVSSHYEQHKQMQRAIRLAKAEGETLIKCGNDIVIAPEIITSMYSIIADGRLAGDTHDDFCANLGYDTDSRTGLQLYLDCQSNYAKLKGAIGRGIGKIEEIIDRLEV